MNRRSTTVCMLALAMAASQVAFAASVPNPSKPLPKHVRDQAEKIYLEGAKALQRDDLQTAKDDFERAAEMVPANTNYALSLEIAKQHLVTQLIQQAAKARIAGDTDTWRAKLAQAMVLDPKNPMVMQHLSELTQEDDASLRTLNEPQETGAEPIVLAPTAVRGSFHLVADEGALIKQVLGAYGITPSIDDSVRKQSVRFDADNVTYAQAVQMLNLVTGTFFVPLDPRRVLAAADTKANRTKYERQTMETIYLPGLTSTEISDMGNIARNIFGATQASIQPNQGTMIVRAPQSKMRALNAAFSEMLDGHSQIQLDLRLYEIDRNRTTDIGVQLPQTTTVFNVPSELNSVLQNNQSLVQQIVSSGLASPGDYAAIAAILLASGQLTGVLAQPFAIFGGGLTLSGLQLGSVTGNLALNSSDTRSLDNVQLRVLDQQEATIRSGTHYPIVTSSYSSLTPTNLGVNGISTPGLSSALSNLGINLSQATSAADQTIPQVQYEDLGLTLRATPHVELDKEVSLKLDLRIEALTGQTLNQNPVLSSRQYTAIISLHPGDSALLISSLSRQQSAAITGLPGISELPGFTSGTNNATQVDTTNLVAVITPHIVRVSHRYHAGRMLLMPAHQ